MGEVTPMQPALSNEMACVLQAYVGASSVSNREVYERTAEALALDPEEHRCRRPVGASGALHNKFHRSVRWHQQNLRRLGLLERLDRGVWQLTSKARHELEPAAPRQVMIAFSTDLGIALWGNCQDVLNALDDEITLCLMSPPYPLAKPRKYGNPDEAEYVQWLCRLIEPAIKKLRQGGNLLLNVSNDIFERGLPSRSLYVERLTLALSGMGLSLMDRCVWVNPTKPPGPVRYASIQRNQLNAGYEHCLWLTNNPRQVVADNRRCLQPHSTTQERLMANGGEKRTAIYADGAYRLRPGSFGNVTPGSIARNVLSIPHRDNDQRVSREWAASRGLPAHSALMPLGVADFFVKFLSEPGDLVVDPTAGWATTGKAAEINGRRWLVVERCREHIAAAAERFRACPGFTST